MKTIVVPLDFSKESLIGLDMAMMLAEKTGANIKMIHVIGKVDNTANVDLELEHLNAKIKIEELLQKCKENNGFNCGLSYVIKEGKIFKIITDLANEIEDAVIVLSTHGKSGFDELFIGGNAYKIISNSKKPVITVRQCRVSTNINRIVLPLDFTLQTREKVPYTVELAKRFNSEIHLVTVRHSNIKSIEKKLLQYSSQMAYYIEAHKVPFKVEHLQGDNLTDVILDYSNSVNADLISIMTEQETSVSNLLFGSYAHQMINKACVPVLTFPTQQITTITESFRTQGVYYS
jgi:nucleotide-binding universal stress UspA family protein